MKTVLLSLTCCILGGCGTYGEPLLLTRMFDSADPCQNYKVLDSGGFDYKQVNGKLVVDIRPSKTTQPSFCGAGSRGRTTIYATPNNNPIGAPVGYTKKN